MRSENYQDKSDRTPPLTVIVAQASGPIAIQIRNGYIVEIRLGMAPAEGDDAVAASANGEPSYMIPPGPRHDGQSTRPTAAVPLRRGGWISGEQLVGKTVQLYDGEMPYGHNFVIDENNVRLTLRAIQEHGLTVAVVAP